MKFLSFFFVSVINTVFSAIYPESEPTFERMLAVRNIMVKCLTGKESITMLKVESLKNFSLQQNKMYQIVESIKPVYVFNSINETSVKTINDMGNELEVPLTTKSYFLMSENIHLMTRNMKFLSQLNTNGQWIFFLMNFRKSDVENVLKFAYSEYKMLNLLVFFLDLDSTIHVATYNPFKYNENNVRGEVFSLQVNLENLSNILINIENFFDKKVANLYGDSLNITYCPEISVMNTFLDNEMFDVFKRKLNCSLNFVPTQDLVFGSRLPNGTLTGWFCNNCMHMCNNLKQINELQEHYVISKMESLT